MTVFVSHASRDTGLPLYDVLLKDLRMRSGHEVWADKVAVAGVGALLIPAALIPAAIGGYKQATLPGRTLSYVESMIPRCTG